MNGVSWKEYVDQGFKERDKAVAAALAANEKRLDALNELRQGVATTEQLEALEKVVDELKDRVNKTEGQSTGSTITKQQFVTYLTIAVSVMGIIILWANSR